MTNSIFRRFTRRISVSLVCAGAAIALVATSGFVVAPAAASTDVAGHPATVVAISSEGIEGDAASIHIFGHTQFRNPGDLDGIVEVWNDSDQTIKGLMLEYVEHEQMVDLPDIPPKDKESVTIGLTKKMKAKAMEKGSITFTVQLGNASGQAIGAPITHSMTKAMS